jgi:hypothetical protein
VRYDTLAGFDQQINSLIVTDLDGQGRNAVIAASSGNAIQILRRGNDGMLASSQVITTAASYVVRVADMNGDGRPDIVGRPFLGSAVQIWLQAGDGSFGAPISVPVNAGGYGDLALGDINGDGRTDIVIFGSEVVLGQEIGIVLQQADGTFAAPSYRPANAPTSMEGVAIGDVNGDGRNDVVVSQSLDSSIGVMLQDGSGQLSAPSTLRIGSSPSIVLVADIDGDGRMDVVSSSWQGGLLAINRQRGDGTLGGAETFPVSAAASLSPGLMAVGDVNGDGLLDIVDGNGWLRQRAVPQTLPPEPARAGGGMARRLGIGRLTPKSWH